MNGDGVREKSAFPISRKTASISRRKVEQTRGLEKYVFASGGKNCFHRNQRGFLPRGV